jgi:hypothetical protein
MVAALGARRRPGGRRSNGSGSDGGENASIVKASERCESTSAGEPRLSAPTRAARRASTDTRSRGAGAGGCQSPPCPGWVRIGCALTATRVTGAPGGCASRSRTTRVRIGLTSTTGYASATLPRVMTSGSQTQPDLQRVGGESRRREPRAETLQHGLEHAREHAERVDLPLEPLRFFPERRRSPRPERIVIEAERQIVGAEARGPEPRGSPARGSAASSPSVRTPHRARVSARSGRERERPPAARRRAPCARAPRERPSPGLRLSSPSLARRCGSPPARRGRRARPLAPDAPDAVPMAGGSPMSRSRPTVSTYTSPAPPSSIRGETARAASSRA